MWVPDDGVGTFFLLTQFVAGQTQPTYKSTSLYQQDAGKWTASSLDPPLRRVLDAPTAGAVLEAIPDTGCCGWSNESDDQTLLRIRGKTLTIFDELGAYKNSDYDVSFYSQNGKLSPDLSSVALTIVATAQPNTAIQLAEQGQANPEESQRIRKALLDLPAVEVKSGGGFPEAPHISPPCNTGGLDQQQRDSYCGVSSLGRLQRGKRSTAKIDHSRRRFRARLSAVTRWINLK